MSFLGIIPKASQTKFHQIRITKSKVNNVQIPLSKLEKRKSGKKISELHNGATRGLQIGARRITNRCRCRDFKSGQKDYKSGQRNFKSGQRLKIGARGISKPLGFNFMNVTNLHSENLQCKYFSTHSLL